MKRHPYLILGLLLVSLLGSFVQAQAQPWDSNIVTWVGPTTCVSGEPVSACAVTGYRVEQASTATGTFTTVITITGLTFTHSSVSAGQHCYRVIAQSAQGDSGPSNVACKTNVKPAGPPNPPVLSVPIVQNTPFVPVYRVGADGKSIGNAMFGLIPSGRECGAYVTTYRGARICRVLVAQSEVWPKTASTANLAAPCA